MSVSPQVEKFDGFYVMAGELVVDDKAEEVERMGLEEEGKFIRKLVDPKLPSKEEVEKHFQMGHYPYRNWCEVCVKAHGKEMGHFKEVEKERRLPEYSIDYCFPGDELGFKWTVLVGKERSSRSFMATAIPHKGGRKFFCKR